MFDHDDNDSAERELSEGTGGRKKRRSRYSSFLTPLAGFGLMLFAADLILQGPIRRTLEPEKPPRRINVLGFSDKRVFDYPTEGWLVARPEDDLQFAPAGEDIQTEHVDAFAAVMKEIRSHNHVVGIDLREAVQDDIQALASNHEGAHSAASDLGQTSWIGSTVSSILWYLKYVVPVLSVICFLAYGIDKFIAKRTSNLPPESFRGRIPEANLLFLGLFGGWPGGLLGQRLFRHKVKDRPFQVQFWISLVANLGAIMWFYYLPGSTGSSLQPIGDGMAGVQALAEQYKLDNPDETLERHMLLLQLNGKDSTAFLADGKQPVWTEIASRNQELMDAAKAIKPEHVDEPRLLAFILQHWPLGEDEIAGPYFHQIVGEYLDLHLAFRKDNPPTNFFSGPEGGYDNTPQLEFAKLLHLRSMHLSSTVSLAWVLRYAEIFLKDDPTSEN